MKIESSSGVGVVGRPRLDARGGAGFSLEGTNASGPATAASGLSQAHAVGAALLLQVESVDPERRKRQVRRAEKTLDALDDMALALLGGRDMGAAERVLQAVLAEAEEHTGEPGLDETLALIGQRAAVEMAKLEMRRGRR